MGEGKRPRIVIDRGNQIVDVETYSTNKCSKNAKRLYDSTHGFKSDVWTDQHYMIRLHIGDENGMREGIDIEDVKSLINDTFNHVVNYALKYGTIINFPPFIQNKSVRIVLQNRMDVVDDILNVAIEYHFVDVHTYEITIWTAMNTRDFFIRDGQYVVQLHHDKTSLFKNMKKTLTQLCEFERL
ncbi:hypothetical protein [Flavobacterium petrolei]|uniref:hypothetical protein n=1 Tax=Flavobacterium petrolei TaxID=2259594 RepID=UPI0037564767